MPAVVADELFCWSLKEVMQQIKGWGKFGAFSLKYFRIAIVASTPEQIGIV